MYEKIEIELRGLQHSLQSSRTVSITPPPSEEPELGDEPVQLYRIADVTEAFLRQVKKRKNRPQWP
jgi:hypothetical protein